MLLCGASAADILPIFVHEQVSKKIGETLAETWQAFHLLNRGVTLVAKKVEYDNKSERVRLFLADQLPEEERLYGILDGGNTNERINKWREERTEEEAATKLSETFVSVQIAMSPKPSPRASPRSRFECAFRSARDCRRAPV